MVDARPLERGSPKTKPRSCGSQPAHESLLNRRLSSVSYLAHLHDVAPGIAGLLAMEQWVDSDHENRLLKKDHKHARA